MGRANQLTRGAGDNALLKMPRDYSWTAFHLGLQAYELQTSFDALWKDLLALPWHRDWNSLAAADAICATLLTHLVSKGPFTRSDFDTLMTPWRCETTGCTRSKVALMLTPSWPHPADELWPVVDAILSQPAHRPQTAPSHALPTLAAHLDPPPPGGQGPL